MKSISAAMIGKRIKVLVESEASADSLQQAQVSSWEHSFLRGGNDDRSSLIRRRYCVARGEADTPDIDGRVYVREALPIEKFA
ncbi:MAG: hypothetical protein M2R45_04860 [Verrucomicrobia subdivision 3 bacterium]|nr:hypothetical protein [Limisphaerales bacterium]MCS1417533.1 hypothetical protein [Limisphaerales bacterium]